MRKILLAVLLIPSCVEARSLTFNKESVNASLLATELKAATGFDFMATCAACQVNGFVSWEAGVLTVHVYESATESPRAIETEWTQGLSDAITAVVNAHTP